MPTERREPEVITEVVKMRRHVDVNNFRSKLSLDDMSVNVTEIKRVAFVGDYLPRKCGIATFTHDLRCGFADRHKDVSCHVCAVNDQGSYAYPTEVRFEFDEQDSSCYQRLADYINTHNVDAVSLQHEYGIYGGDCGEMILSFLREVRVPVVTTLHTILMDPNPQQKRVMEGVLALSARVVTMTDKGRELLLEVYHADCSRIDVIPHGIPEFNFCNPDDFKGALGLDGHRVLLTFGLLSPNKGLEFAIRALPSIVKEFPNLLYVILGQTHPNLIRDHGEAYRNSLQWLANDLGVGENVKFVNCFVDLDLLKRYIAATDVYVTPYLHEAQITSGTLSYAFGMGSVVVSTPYWHAVDLLRDGRGIIVPFREAEPLSSAIGEVLRDDARRNEMRLQAFEIGRSMTWSRVSELYHDAFERARSAPRTRARFVIEDVEALALPKVKLDHFRTMLDRTGVLRYCYFTIPEFSHGYCTDDNAAALTLLTTLAGHSHKENKTLAEVGCTLLAYLLFSADRESGMLRSKLSYERVWQPTSDSEASLSHARALSSLGRCCRTGLHVEVAKRLFLEFMETSRRFDEAVCIAYALDGATQYLGRYVADAPVVELQQVLANKLVLAYDNNSKPHTWEWFEEDVGFANGVIPKALINAGAEAGNQDWLNVGLKTLGWLCDAQSYPEGRDAKFAPIGPGFQPNVEYHHQLPIGVSTTISAAVAAFKHTANSEWMEVALTAMDWFLGKNCLGVAVYDPQTGGTQDGIHNRKLNLNQGMEATLAFLQSLAELRGCLRKTVEFLEVTPMQSIV